MDITEDMTKQDVLDSVLEILKDNHWLILKALNWFFSLYDCNYIIKIIQAHTLFNCIVHSKNHIITTVHNFLGGGHKKFN